jgi:hypothetical protein
MIFSKNLLKKHSSVINTLYEKKTFVFFVLDDGDVELGVQIAASAKREPHPEDGKKMTFFSWSKIFFLLALNKIKTIDKPIKRKERGKEKLIF